MVSVVLNFTASLIKTATSGVGLHMVEENSSTTENLRQQILLNTIANLKKSLEDQSASLKQVYECPQNIQL